ncbi:type I restriction-modification system subunit M N-terminal domain-containing protein [Methylobacter luteus]|nr:type I restriction-modification system subunit M N-terminal domain-containing protein [Methylobacter luteus]
MNGSASAIKCGKLALPNRIHARRPLNLSRLSSITDNTQHFPQQAERIMLDDIKKTLWATADKLRANMDAAEYKHLVLGLIFVKYVSDTFAARRGPNWNANLPTRPTITISMIPN